MIDDLALSFPEQLDVVKNNLIRQTALLKQVASVYADALGSGGLVHIYANGHSRVTVEETTVRMGALTGFHPLLSGGLTTFTDVIGSNGLRMCQFFEKVEGSGKQQLAEVDFGPNDVLLVVTATGTTIAAVDIALEFNKQYPELPLVALASAEQSQQAPVKHSSGLNLWHVVKAAKNGYFIDNGMPSGDLTVGVNGQTGTYQVCPLSSIGALAVTQSLNELTIKELDRRGIAHPVLRNMHLDNTADNYDSWLRDQRKRYAMAKHHPQAVKPNI
ncbi:SIS domain-containing protein [Pedobacter heparinus]|uniref:SIS domain-containing protein n=1 Tax=Pedobacter heparinus TaxID=984 RepID=UPI00292F02C1|nr:SIS domain-containing protein [Pedobacter heparinus]